MSKATNPGTEGNITCGFYNSVADESGQGDRLYDANQMSAIFDGLINDGIFESIGDRMIVTATTTPSRSVNVGTGKCWFNHTWTVVDDIFTIDCEAAHSFSPRIDAIVVEVDSTDAVRDNFIKVIHGDPAASPNKPSLDTGNDKIHRHALAYITRQPNSDVITQADIEDAVMSGETPLVTGIVEINDLSKYLTQWSEQLKQYTAAGEKELDAFIKKEQDDFKTESDKITAEMEELETKFANWTDSQKNTFIAWFNEMKGQLNEDSAGNLQSQINADEVERYLVEGLPDGIKTISDDGTTIKTVGSTGLILIKTFTDSFLTITSVLTDEYGTELGRLIKKLSSDGKAIEATLTNNHEVIPSLVEIERSLDTIIDSENTYIGEEIEE